jgi:hypothetical protein
MANICFMEYVLLALHLLDGREFPNIAIPICIHNHFTAKFSLCLCELCDKQGSLLVAPGHCGASALHLDPD